MSYTPNRIGDINQAGSPFTDLFLKVFAGEILVSYDKSTVTEGNHVTRKIESGKEAQFPALGDFTASLMTVGAELTGSSNNFNERVIAIDGLLVAHTIIHDIDAFMNHYDVRAPIVHKLGRALAVASDYNRFLEGIKGARSAATLTGGFSGVQIEDDNFKVASGGAPTSNAMAEAIATAIGVAAESLDDRDVPDEDRVAYLRPNAYRSLTRLMTTDGWSPVSADLGGEGSIATGTIMQLEGIRILKSNNIPKANVSTGNHAASCLKTIGFIGAREAIGSVILRDVAFEVAWDHRLQGWYLIAKVAAGFGFLRPECCVELKLDALTIA